MRVGIALVPNPELQMGAITLRSTLEFVGLKGPELGLSENLPHVSLLQFDLAEVDQATSIIEQIHKRGRPLIAGSKLVFDRVVFHPPDWIFWCCERQEWLSEIQQVALSVCRPFMHQGAQHARRTDEMTTAEQASYREFGYRFVGEAFLPHITLGRLDEGASPTCLERVDPAVLRFASTGSSAQITVYEVGPGGAHVRSLAQALV